MTEIIIKPQKFVYYNFKEIYEFKDTLFFLAWKDIKIKYKQAFLGFMWAILQPLLMTLVFVVFSKITNYSFGNSLIPYPMFVLTGILLWNLFSSAVVQSSNSIVSNAHIIKKIYFPRIFFPLSALIVSTFDFIITFLVLIPFMFYYEVFPKLDLLYVLPLTYLLLSMLIIGVGSFFAALNVKYRDVKYIIPFLVQLLFFISPIFYSNNIIDIKWLHSLYYMNPITGFVELFRYGFFGTPIVIDGLCISIITCLIIFFFGSFYFRKIEHNFADIS